MKTSTLNHFIPKQAVLPILIQDYLDICDPVLTFDRFMEEIDLEKYLKSIPKTLYGKIKIQPGQHAENSIIRIYDKWLHFITRAGGSVQGKSSLYVPYGS